jgi:hypothetical protein
MLSSSVSSVLVALRSALVRVLVIAKLLICFRSLGLARLSPLLNNTDELLRGCGLTSLRWTQLLTDIFLSASMLELLTLHFPMGSKSIPIVRFDRYIPTNSFS